MKLLVCLFLFCPYAIFAQAFSFDHTVTGHEAMVTYVAAHPSESIVVSGDKDGGALAWDYVRQKQVWKKKHHKGQITDIKFSADGKWLAFASYDGSISIWSWPGMKLLSTIENSKASSYDGMSGNELSFVNFLGKGEEIIYGGYNKIVFRQKKRQDKRQQILKAQFHSINAGVVHEREGILATASGPSITITDLTTGKAMRSLKLSNNFEDYPCELAFVPDQKNLIVAWSVDGSICIWDYIEGKLMDKIKAAKTEGSSDLVFSNAGTYLLTGNYGNDVKLWDAVSWRLLQLLEGHSAPASTFAFSHDDKYIFTGSRDKSLKVWTQREVPVQETSKFEKRDEDVQNTITIRSKNIKLSFWDDQKIDGDIISVNINGEWVVEELELAQEPMVIDINLKGENDSLIIYAHNEGSISPNTVALSIFDGYIERRMTLKSDLKTNARLNFSYEP